jgi:hypothetical protein
MSTLDQSRKAIRRLVPGTVVGHANPRLADWEGTVVPGRGRMADLGRDVRVKWHAGTVDGDGRVPAPMATCWMDATALTVKGEDPDCARPAHYIFAGNDWDRSEGWHHDEQHDSMTCWAGKATFERQQREGLYGSGNHPAGDQYGPADMTMYDQHRADAS